MNIFDKITESELAAIDKYIYNNIDTIDGRRNTDMKWILRCWADAKSEYLEKMFGNSLILSKPVSFQKGIDEIAEEIDKVIFNRHPKDIVSEFIDEFFEIEHKYSRDNLNYVCLSALIDIYTLAKNIYNYKTFELENPKNPNKPIKIQKGCKATKAIGKIAEAYDIEGFEEFRLEHSRCLNQKALHGTLCLSIHPLDYMTMSDNSYGWTSCMSWEENGCYRQGTVEMMNSPMVVVAYLEGEEPYYIGKDFSWNNKKWRELFLVTPEMISNVKGYPYRNDNLSKIVIEWLKILAEKAGIGTYTNNVMEWSSEDRFDIPELEISQIYISPSTNYMYNDFSNHQLAVFGQELKNRGSYYYPCYSGQAECMNCGETDFDMEESDFLVASCCMEVVECDECGRTFYNNENFMEVDGRYICPFCYDEYTIEDRFTGEIHFEDNMTKLYVGKKEEDGSHAITSNYIFFYDEDFKTFSKEELSKYFSEIHSGIYKVYNGSHSIVYYVLQEDFTDEGARLFGYSSYERFKEDIKYNFSNSWLQINSPVTIIDSVKDFCSIEERYLFENNELSHWMLKTVD